MPRGSTRLQLAALVLLTVAILRILELLPLIPIAAYEGSSSLLRAAAFYALMVLTFHGTFVFVILIFAIGLLLGREGMYRLLVAHSGVILSVFSVLSFISFTVGVVVSSLLLIFAILLLVHPEARREVEEADYNRPPMEAALRVIEQRRRIRQEPRTEGDERPIARARSRSVLCPQCDGLNPEGTTTCRHCGTALPAR